MQLLENLDMTEGDTGSVYACRKCKAVVGPATGDYKRHAAHYDEDINFGEPASRHAVASPYVLRHYLCGACGSLFEVDMVRASDAPFRSVEVKAAG